MTDSRTEPSASTTGLTRDAGWELGVRRTAAVPPETAWDHLVGRGGPTWLGVTPVPTAVGAGYRAADGTTGRIRSCSPGRRIRLTWRPAGWTHDSVLQLTVLPAAGGATIALHQEHLADAGERNELLAHWTTVVEGLVAELQQSV
ncbi:SRPBCC family protein [Nakamurella leprariae]|uniref:SRPBCC domain-containing protein n=1 Tax=Nakamurella leprariae TaxID=2803911 RepID=A0A938YCD6_9ACTN|nr:SRPBCC domain-containing protein [Nakamurella leprariae]MBM9467038.1 SRPBCC domain-containing protein [Nakamurella leprariae]